MLGWEITNFSNHFFLLPPPEIFLFFFLIFKGEEIPQILSSLVSYGLDPTPSSNSAYPYEKIFLNF